MSENIRPNDRLCWQTNRHNPFIPGNRDYWKPCNIRLFDNNMLRFKHWWYVDHVSFISSSWETWSHYMDNETLLYTCRKLTIEKLKPFHLSLSCFVTKELNKHGPLNRLEMWPGVQDKLVVLPHRSHPIDDSSNTVN